MLLTFVVILTVWRFLYSKSRATNQQPTVHTGTFDLIPKLASRFILYAFFFFVCVCVTRKHPRLNCNVTIKIQDHMRLIGSKVITI